VSPRGSAGYRQATDRQGRTTLEMRVDRYALLVIGGFASTLVWMILEGGWPGAIGGAVTGLTFSAAYQRQRAVKAMSVKIDPQTRTLTLGGGKGERVLKFSEVARAQLNSEQRRKPDMEWHRIDLVLRSGEVVPLMNGFPSDDKEPTLAVIATIDKAVA